MFSTALQDLGKNGKGKLLISATAASTEFVCNNLTHVYAHEKSRRVLKKDCSCLYKTHAASVNLIYHTVMLC